MKLKFNLKKCHKIGSLHKKFVKADLSGSVPHANIDDFN
jgi:hypothetical protein